MTKTILITANLISALFLLIILFGLYISIKKRNEKTKYFIWCLWICLFGLIFDGLSYLLDGFFEKNFLLYFVDFFSYITIDVLVACYSIYFCSFIKENDDKFSNKYSYYVFSLCILDFIFLTIGSINGNLFKVENGSTIEGPWGRFIFVMPLIVIISTIVVIIKEIKKINRANLIAFGSYIMFFIVSLLLQLMNEEFELGYVGAALSMVVIYVMIQSKSVNESNLKADIYSELSTKDVLTGLKNRRGYENVISSVANINKIGVVFCDINSLKTINDTLGHDSGDRIIQKLSNILEKEFPNDDNCRISGDEFVTIIKNVDEEFFNTKIADLKEALSINNSIASFGYAIGDGKMALDVVRSAERMMYSDKEKFYINTGKSRRV